MKVLMTNMFNNVIYLFSIYIYIFVMILILWNHHTSTIPHAHPSTCQQCEDVFQN